MFYLLIGGLSGSGQTGLPSIIPILDLDQKTIKWSGLPICPGSKPVMGLRALPIVFGRAGSRSLFATLFPRKEEDKPGRSKGGADEGGEQDTGFSGLKSLALQCQAGNEQGHGKPDAG